MAEKLPPIPIYKTSGEVGAFLIYPYVYNPIGDWIGWVSNDRQIYSVFGKYVGWLSYDKRILRRRSEELTESLLPPPPPSERFIPPSLVPLPPMMAELKYEIVDVLDEMPDLMPTLDSFAFEDEA
jgi:hypothetical protein